MKVFVAEYTLDTPRMWHVLTSLGVNEISASFSE